MIQAAIPVLHVSIAAAAEEFYRRLGFEKQFEFRVNSNPDPCYMGFARDGVMFHASSFPGDGVFGAVMNLITDDVDALHAELVASGVAIDLAPIDQDWGSREMYIRDPDGNRIRYQSTG